MCVPCMKFTQMSCVCSRGIWKLEILEKIFLCFPQFLHTNFGIIACPKSGQECILPHHLIIIIININYLNIIKTTLQNQFSLWTVKLKGKNLHILHAVSLHAVNYFNAAINSLYRVHHIVLLLRAARCLCSL